MLDVAYNLRLFFFFDLGNCFSGIFELDKTSVSRNKGYFPYSPIDDLEHIHCFLYYFHDVGVKLER